MSHAQGTGRSVVPEITYLPEVECEIKTGMLETLIVGVPDSEGNRQWLRVGKGDVVTEAGKTYLPVGVVELDREKQRVLVELPYEADSGFKRLWVLMSKFRQQRA